MPDVSRSDSQRSDTSRPRVSFNRDVHVKRISTPGAPRVIGALAGDGEGHLVPLPVRRERPTRLSRRELAKEAERVLAQADSVACTSQSFVDQKGNKDDVNSNRKFNTLPPLRRRNKKNRANKTNPDLQEESPSSSLDRNTIKSKQINKKSHNIDKKNTGKDSPVSSLERRSPKSGGGKNIIASVFSSLDRSLSKRNKYTSADVETDSFKYSKRNSSSLNDLADNSSSSPERTKKHRTGLKRSVSDASSRKNAKSYFKSKKSGGFLSLDRLIVKRNKNKNKNLAVHSDYSDRSPSRPRKNILKKSHSDSESTSQLTTQEQNQQLQGEGRKKKQLSPIIEVLPREDYFHENKSSRPLPNSEIEETMLHSSQLPTQKPALTRGQTVDAMVKRLSQDFTRSRGPPRVVNSAPGLITPEYRQHNNNLPFSYTEPTTHQYGSSAPTAEPTRDSPLDGRPAAVARSPTAVDGQVIYAEVVVSGGGSSGGAVSKQTVHTKVHPITQLQPEEPIHPKVYARQLEEAHFQQTSKVFPSEAYSKDSSHKVTVKVTDNNRQGSDEDEGLGLTMDHNGYRRNSMDYIDDGKIYGRKGVFDNYTGVNNYTNKSYVEKRIRNGEEERSSLHNSARKEVRTDYSGNNMRKEYSVQESKYESENYIIDPSARGKADGMDSRKREFIISEGYNNGRYDDAFYHRSADVKNDISPIVKRNFVDDYVRNENYKTEFRSDARIIPPDETDGRGHYGRDPLSRSINSNDLSSRRDRLESRIESQRKDRFVNNKHPDTGSFKRDTLDTRNEINKKYGAEVAYNSRRDFLNSQLDYDRNPAPQEEIRYENDKSYGLKSSRYFESSTITTEVDNYGKKDLFADSGIEVDYRTKDSSTNNRKYDKHDAKLATNNSNHHTQNVTRVDLRNHSRDHVSDDEDVEVNEKHHHNSANHYSDTTHHHKTKTTNTLTSTRLVQEQKHTEAIPSSTVLIRHWVPPSKEDSSTPKHKHTQPSKTKHEKTQQPLLSDEEYEEYEKSRRKDEYRKDVTEELRKREDKAKGSDEKGHKSVVDKKVTKKKQTSAMDKMKQLFTRSDNKSGKKKKKDDKVKVIVETVDEEDEEVDPLRARYTEYRGSDIDLRHEDSPKPYRDRGHQKGNNTESEQQETPRPVLKNRKLKPGSPRDQRHLRASNSELNQDTSYYSQKGHGSPKSSHKDRNHHTRGSNAELDEGTPRPSHREGIRGHHRIPSDIDEHKESKHEEYHRPVRQRLATPSPSPSPPRAPNKSTSATLTRINNMKNKEQHSNGSGGWFKSLDRLTKRGKNRAKDQDTDITTEDEIKTIKQNNNNNSSSNKNLRFFGDTDQESVSSILRQPTHPVLRRYKSNNNNTNGTSTNNRLQVPSGGGGPRHHRSAGDVATSSAESTTEGDSSQQSQRSVVYLHAATVGDIPGPPRAQRSGVARRAQSREELSSTAGSSRPLQPQTRTVSRSISVLAPWKPRHYKEGLEVHYDNDSSSKTLGRNNGKPPKVPVPHQPSGNSTMNRSSGGNRYKSNGDRGKENHTLQKQKVNKAMSVESLSRKNGDSNHGQYIKDRRSSDKKRSALNSSASVESLNQKQNRDRSANTKKHSALNSSAMELNSNKSYRTATKKGSEGNSKRSSAKVSRSASMPKDSRLTAGWFKLRNKKQGT